MHLDLLLLQDVQTTLRLRFGGRLEVPTPPSLVLRRFLELLVDMGDGGFKHEFLNPSSTDKSGVNYYKRISYGLP